MGQPATVAGIPSGLLVCRQVTVNLSQPLLYFTQPPLLDTAQDLLYDLSPHPKLQKDAHILIYGSINEGA
ncbi:hypothetical protein J6590_060543, partial [Homalodisca vitripennis]